MPDFDLFTKSGLYDSLRKKKLVVSHESIPAASYDTPKPVRIIEPEQIPHISYPFEWSFSQLQDAALLTLLVQKQALKHAMTLKDASAYNVQFLNGRPIFIDTLSFEKYVPGAPWQAYRQFCQHFLAPLALMAHTDLRLSQLQRVHLDGIPLDLTAKLLPRAAKLRLGIAMHLVVHGRAQQSKASTHQKPKRAVSQTSLEAILDSLERTIRKLKPRRETTEWDDYYDKTNYSVDAADLKGQIIADLVEGLKLGTALDLGGNNGRYSRVLNNLGIRTVCSDIDPNAVEANYRHVREYKENLMLPLVVDLTSPAGALGWRNTERAPIHERLQCDAVMALALIHHLAISNNLPLEKIASYFREFAPYCIVEFVPKSDSQTAKLLATRKDIFPEYTDKGFLKAFGHHFKLLKEQRIKGTERTLYLFKRK